ncbi:MAG: chorismate synthase [Rhodospirillaceae bacterium]|nr:chorismate synthase [Rhodospirillaceae bacterium]
MPGNAFGTAFRFATWGESHGPAIGCIVDGVPPRIPLTEDEIQPWLDRRRPGQSKFVTQRKEPDTVRILSGTFDGVTTGSPIALIIENADQRSRDYSEIKDLFRPGHADYTYWKKYGIRDFRGGGRASARETAMRVAAGAVARQVLAKAWGDIFKIRGAMIKMGPLCINDERWDWDIVSDNPFWCPDAKALPLWERFLDTVRKEGSSAGAVVEIHGEGVPAGLGEPVYDKIDADLAKAMMSINAVKGVEIGQGFASAALAGEYAHDAMRMLGGEVVFKSNRSGGVLGGITNGQPVIARFAVKPTSSLLKPQQTVTVDGRETMAITKGRHDPCVGIRAVPVGEAMMACVLADHWLRHQGQTGRQPD